MYNTRIQFFFGFSEPDVFEFFLLFSYNYVYVRTRIFTMKLNYDCRVYVGREYERNGKNVNETTAVPSQSL